MPSKRPDPTPPAPRKRRLIPVKESLWGDIDCDQCEEMGEVAAREDVVLINGHLVHDAHVIECLHCQAYVVMDSESNTDGFVFCGDCALGTCANCDRDVRGGEAHFEVPCGGIGHSLLCAACSENHTLPVDAERVEHTEALGQKQFGEKKCTVCQCNYDGDDFDQVVRSGHTNDKVHRGCAAPCSLCKRVCLLDGKEGRRVEGNGRIVCGMCDTPCCVDCDRRVGDVADECEALTDHRFRCANCVGVDK